MIKPLLFVTVIILFISCTEKSNPMKTQTLFVGTYTDGTSEGIYSLQFNPKTGMLDSLKLRAKLPNPSFLAISGDKKNLYAVQETADFDSLGGGVTAFSLEDGLLKELNSKGTGGAHPCHVSLSADGELAVANYTGGNMTLFDLADDGSLGSRQLIDHKILDTIKTAHVHKADFTEDGLFVADLGLDAVKRYFKQDDNWAVAHQSSIDLPKGAGPRHFVFSTDRSFLYVINELNSTITVLKRDDEGSYNPVQTQNTSAENYKGDNSCADIHLSPDGRFLYGSNRGENSIVIFSVDEQNGKISLVGREPVQGDWPRNFTIDPTGKYLLVANQKSNNITVFTRHPEEGTLDFVSDFEVSSPVCLVFN